MTSTPRSESSRPTHRHFHRIAWLAVALALGIIVFGAFVRLSHAGLSCPDWPTCYGRATWPAHAGEAADHAATAVRVFEDSKAWREQVHRHLAAILGVIVLVLALLGARRRPRGIAQVLAAATLVGLSIPLYMQANYTLAAVLAIAGELILLAAAVRWNDSDLARISALTLMVIIIQALLGLWTVTWLLKPVVVMAHLLGGLTTFSLLLWMAWRRWLWVALAVLGVQIALGGWVSANYAALACGTYFPTCAGTWTPPADFREGFVLWRGIGVDFEGGVLDGASRIAIQLAHRIGAVVASIVLVALAVRLLRTPGLRGWGAVVALLTIAQVSLGIANVQLSLPLGVAVAHNGGAALLLAALVTLLARIRPPRVAAATA
jgi:cytochrome c oxidase assembly protein subunit 15